MLSLIEIRGRKKESGKKKGHIYTYTLNLKEKNKTRETKKETKKILSTTKDWDIGDFHKPKKKYTTCILTEFEHF